MRGKRTALFEGFTHNSLIIDEAKWRLSPYSPTVSDCRTSTRNASSWKSPCLGGQSPGVDGQGYCAEGHYGPLCELCNQTDDSTRKYFNENLARCDTCPSVQGRATLLIIIAAALLIIVGLAVLILYKMRPPEFWRDVVNSGRRAVVRAGSHALVPKLKILLALHQSLAAIPGVYNILLSPWYYEQTQPISEPANINWDVLVVPGECLKFDRFSSFHSRLVLRGTVPFGFIFILAVLKLSKPYMVRLTAPAARRVARASVPYLERAASSESPKIKKFGEAGREWATKVSRLASKDQVAKQKAKLDRSISTRLYDLVPLVLLILFSFCATVSKGVFSSWDCVKYEVSHNDPPDMRSFLRSDVSVECNRDTSEEYKQIERSAYILLAIWPVILPIMFMLALIPIRKDLMEKRNTKLVQATAFLHKEYEPQFFFWEPLNVVQRLFTIGFVQLVGSEWMRLQIGLSITIIYTIALLYFKPYKRDDIDTLAIGAQICLLGCFIGSLNIKLFAVIAATDSSNNALSNITAGVVSAIDITGFQSQRQAEMAMVFFNFLTISLFILSTIYISLTSKVPSTVRLKENSLPPEIGLQPGRNFHAFISHAWSSGQDQAAGIKRQLQ